MRTLAEAGNGGVLPVVLTGAGIGLLPGALVSPLLPMTGGSTNIAPMTAIVGAVYAALAWGATKAIAPRSLVTPGSVVG